MVALDISDRPGVAIKTAVARIEMQLCRDKRPGISAIGVADCARCSAACVPLSQLGCSPIRKQRCRNSGFVPDAHGAQSTCDDAAIDPIPITDEVARSLIPRKCFRYLTCNPFRRRMCCDVDPDEVSAAESDDDEGIEQIEADGRDDKQVWRQCLARGYARRSAIPGWAAPAV